MSSARFDASEARGEINYLRNALDGNDPDERKKAAKRVVNLMRAGENVQVLFSSMLRCVKTDDLELKKLTYLYLISYSSHEPEQAIMAVNTFIQDSEDYNPLIRALAVRNMCRIRLDSVAEYMIIPLKKALSDKDPYVRKTAAFGVAKLYDSIPEAVENSQLFAELLKLLHDENPMVVSNTTAAICEINERRTSPIFKFDDEKIVPILNALTGCSEWCQGMLLDTLCKFRPNPSNVQPMIDRLMPFLKHANPSVVIGAFKCIYTYMNESDSVNAAELFGQIVPPLLSLVNSAEPEIQYVVLRTISLFVNKYPKFLNREIRMFFCKYNDPSYVKMEKLDIIVTVCSATSIQLVLDELAEYTNAVDVAFVRKTIRCVGQIAVKMGASARRCVDILVGCLNGKADYAVEEAIIVVCDIFRMFPGQFESILATICASLELVKEPKAKAAGIWLLGEYCHIIDKVDLLLDPYLDTFHDETPLVQLQILSALVKLFIHNPDESKDMLQCVLTEATKDTNVPDVKNRAMLYWRLLSGDLSTATDIIKFEKQTVIADTAKYTPDVLNELIDNMASVAGVLHVLPGTFVRRVKFVPDDDLVIAEERLHNWTPVRLNDDSYLQVSIDFDETHMYLRLVNKAMTTLSQFAVALNKNVLGLNVVGSPKMPDSLEFGDSAEVVADIKCDPAYVGNIDKKDLQLAVRTNLGNVFGLSRIPVEVATTEQGKITDDTFRLNFTNYQCQSTVNLDACTIASDEQLLKRKVYVTGKNENKTYVSFAITGCDVFVAELTANIGVLSVLIKSANPAHLALAEANAQYLFAQICDIRAKSPSMSSVRLNSITDPSGRFERKDECITINASVIRYKAYDRETGLEVTWHETILPDDITKTGAEEICQYTERLKKLKHAGMHSILHYWYSAEQNKMFCITESISINSVYMNIAAMSRTETVKNKIIVRWFTPVLQVLQYLHSQSPPIIHNRLSLSSIYAKPTSGSIKLMAPLLVNRQKGSTLYVDPDMPPEFLNGDVGTFSDIWRFGLTVLTVVTREVPFSECKTPYELIDKLRNYKPPACLALVSDKMLHDMISSCLTPPIMRASATELLNHPFFSQNFDEEDEKTGKVSDDGLVVIFSGKSTKSGQTLPKAETYNK